MAVGGHGETLGRVLVFGLLAAFLAMLASTGLAAAQVPGQECTPESTRCFEWKAKWGSEAGGNDVPGIGTLTGRHTALSPDGSRLFVVASSGDIGISIVAFGTADGNTLWGQECCKWDKGYEWAGALAASPHGGGVAIVGASYPGYDYQYIDGCVGHVVNLRPSDGTEIWSRTTSAARGCWDPEDVVVSNNAVIAMGRLRTDSVFRGKVVAYRLGDGERLWTMKTPPGDENSFETYEDLAISADGRVLYVVHDLYAGKDPQPGASWAMEAYALRSDGPPSILWSRRVKVGNPPSGLELTSDSLVYVMGSGDDAVVSSVAKRTGVRLWTTRLSNSWPMGHLALAVDEHKAYVSVRNWDDSTTIDGTDVTAALRLRDGEAIWRDSYISTARRTAAIGELYDYPLVGISDLGPVLVSRGYGQVDVRLLDDTSGELIWHGIHRAESSISATSVVSDLSRSRIFVTGAEAENDGTGADVFGMAFETR